MRNRPSELTAALALLPASYGAFVAIHIDKPAAAILAVVVAIVPWFVSTIIDSIREPNDPGDRVATAPPPVKKGKDEKIGLEHDRSGT